MDRLLTPEFLIFAAGQVLIFVTWITVFHLRNRNR